MDKYILTIPHSVFIIGFELFLITLCKKRIIIGKSRMTSFFFGEQVFRLDFNYSIDKYILTILHSMFIISCELILVILSKKRNIVLDNTVSHSTIFQNHMYPHYKYVEELWLSTKAKFKNFFKTFQFAYMFEWIYSGTTKYI